MSQTYVLYHKNCSDGFGAAWAMWRKFGDDAIYIPVAYGDPVPKLLEDSDVYLVDFSYDRETLIGWKNRFAKLVVLDHHKTAQAALDGLDFAHFDMNKSGSVLAWEHVFPDEEVPLLLQYVQDRDLWTFKLPSSRVMNDAIGSYQMDFHVWTELSIRFDDQDMFDDLFSEGMAIFRIKQREIASAVAHARHANIGSYRVPVCNATSFISDVGERLLQDYPEAFFVGIYYIDDATGKVRWSLRSRPDFDCSEVAVRFGGGGHRCASGFGTELGDDILDRVYHAAV